MNHITRHCSRKQHRLSCVLAMSVSIFLSLNLGPKSFAEDTLPSEISFDGWTLRPQINKEWNTWEVLFKRGNIEIAHNPTSLNEDETTRSAIFSSLIGHFQTTTVNSNQRNYNLVLVTWQTGAANRQIEIIILTPQMKTIESHCFFDTKGSIRRVIAKNNQVEIQLTDGQTRWFNPSNRRCSP